MCWHAISFGMLDSHYVLRRQGEEGTVTSRCNVPAGLQGWRATGASASPLPIDIWGQHKPRAHVSDREGAPGAVGGKARPSGLFLSLLACCTQAVRRSRLHIRLLHRQLSLSARSASKLSCSLSSHPWVCSVGAAGKVVGHEKLLQTLHQQFACGRSRHPAVLLAGCSTGPGGVSPAQVCPSCCIPGLHFCAHRVPAL